METIQEYKDDYIKDFLIYCGIDLEASYSKKQLDEIIGSDIHPFVDGTDYFTIYEYIKSINSHKSIIVKEKIDNVVIEDNYLKFPYVKRVMVCISIALWIINFVRIPGSIIYRCAKGFGLNLRIWPLFLMTMMCRSLLYGKIQKHTAYHIYAGYLMLISLIGHTLCHLINTIRNDIQYITGYILVFMIILISVSSYFRHRCYHVFSNIHRLTYFILPLMIVHCRELWIWFMCGILLISLESLYNFLFKTQISTLTNSRISKYENLIYLNVQKAIPIANGAYYRIMIPSISFEWHSFSVANSNLIDQLLFIISIRGDWTKKLEEKLKVKSNSYVFVMGPFYTSSTEILNNEYDKCLCIAGGIGIAPYLSVMDTKVQLSRVNCEYRSNYLDTIEEENFQQRQSLSIQNIATTFERKLKYPLDVIWILREPQQLTKYITDIISSSNSVNLIIYVTGKFSKEEEIYYKFFMFKMLENARDNIKCCFFKPSLKYILNKHKPKKVFFCGSDRLEKDLQTLCYNMNISLSCEKFD